MGENILNKTLIILFCVVSIVLSLLLYNAISGLIMDPISNQQFWEYIILLCGSIIGLVVATWLLLEDKPWRADAW